MPRSKSASKIVSTTKSTSSLKKRPVDEEVPLVESKKKRSAISSENFHWADNRDEAFTSLIISKHVFSQSTSAQQKRMCEKTVKEYFDQDIFVDDKVKFYDALATDTELREALIRRFKSRLTC